MRYLIVYACLLLVFAPTWVVGDTFPQGDGTCMTTTYSQFKGKTESKRWPYPCGCLEYSEFSNQYRNKCGNNQNVDARRAQARREEAARHEELMRGLKELQEAVEERAKPGGPSTINRGNAGAINPRTGEFLAPSGGGGYTGTRDGRYYAPARPNGVIDTRTGQFIPVN